MADSLSRTARRMLAAMAVLVLLTFFSTIMSAQSRGAAVGAKRAASKNRIKSERELERERKPRAVFNAALNKRRQNGKTVVLPMEFHGVSAPLAELAKEDQKPLAKENGMLQESETEPLVEEPRIEPKTPLEEPFVQTRADIPLGAVAGTNFEGPGTGLTGFSMTGAPPDTTMAVGPNHIVAWVNSQYAVFDKSGNKLLGPVNGNTLFSGVANLCATTNRGDPILQYDRLADRWILSQFAFNVSGSNPAAPYLQCIAVSTTNDPTGSYYRYSITFGSTSPDGFNDYGKLGIWNDAYYTAYNVFGGSPAGSNTGAALCASDRTKMLAGDATATTLCAPTAFYGGGASFLPADMDGTTLPSDTTRGGVFMRLSTAPALRIVRLKPNFATSTVTITDGFGGASGSFVNFALPTTNRPCNGTGGTCVAQPNTTNTLDTLGDRLMYRLAYRNRDGVESLLVTHSVDPDGAGSRSSALRWYEIRNPLGNPSDADVSKRPFIYQNGTFDPGATGDRWMGSVAMDKYGNILAGYSLANASSGLSPSLAISGRSQCDSLNTLQSEQIAQTGTGSQTGTLARWGDYSTMQVDPSDDATFWYIGEYLSANGTFNWRTRIISFKFAATTATSSGDFNDASNWSNGLPSTGIVGIVPSGKTMSVNSPTSVCTLDVQSGGNLVMNADLNVTGSLTLGTKIDTGSSKLGLGCNATVTGASSSSYVVGSVKKDYCSTGAFNFPIGTTNGYSPVSTNVTTLTVNPSSLEIRSKQGVRVGLDSNNSVKRYWTLTETGDLTTNLVFNYNDPLDVAGTEANYKLYRWTNFNETAVTPFTLDTAANTVSVNGVSSFSDWTIGTLLGPTAANVSVSGRVMTPTGAGLRGAVVMLTAPNGTTQTTTTSSFGYYRFNGVEAGQTYIVGVNSKRYSFTSQSIFAGDDLGNLDFIALP